MKTGRNDLCHCESGKKFKDCHGTSSSENSWKKMAIIGAIVLLALWFIQDIYSAGKGGSMGSAPPGKVWSEEHGHYHDIKTSLPPVSTMPQGVQRNLEVSQPEGPVPEGKIWSTEHGHWHDLNAAPSQVNPNAGSPEKIPQPDGPAPEGKVWSIEHGHWHDITPPKN